MRRRYPDTTANKSQSAASRASTGTRETDARRAKRPTRLRGVSTRDNYYNNIISGAVKAKGKVPKKISTAQRTKEAPV